MSPRFICHARRCFSIVYIVLFMSACSSVRPLDYAQEFPQLDFKKYLQGNLSGWGIFQDRSGKVTKRFRIEMLANWQGNMGSLTENFSFNDGTKQTRKWQLTRQDAQHYTGKANDSVGEGKGEQQGNSMHWQYTIRTETDSGVYDLDYDYWMYMIDDKTLINRATLSKFGFTLGTITVTFHKG